MIINAPVGTTSHSLHTTTSHHQNHYNSIDMQHGNLLLELYLLSILCCSRSCEYRIRCFLEIHHGCRRGPEEGSEGEEGEERTGHRGTAVCKRCWLETLYISGSIGIGQCFIPSNLVGCSILAYRNAAYGRRWRWRKQSCHLLTFSVHGKGLPENNATSTGFEYFSI
jgi:hypothetical protein